MIIVNFRLNDIPESGMAKSSNLFSAAQCTLCRGEQWYNGLEVVQLIRGVCALIHYVHAGGTFPHSGERVYRHGKYWNMGCGDVLDWG